MYIVTIQKLEKELPMIKYFSKPIDPSDTVALNFVRFYSGLLELHKGRPFDYDPKDDVLIYLLTPNKLRLHIPTGNGKIWRS